MSTCGLKLQPGCARNLKLMILKQQCGASWMGLRSLFRHSTTHVGVWRCLVAHACIDAAVILHVCVPLCRSMLLRNHVRRNKRWRLGSHAAQLRRSRSRSECPDLATVMVPESNSFDLIFHTGIIAIYVHLPILTKLQRRVCLFFV